ncbi:MAG: sugar ABC transporter substrate-binding protein [Specibacter sp.]
MKMKSRLGIVGTAAMSLAAMTALVLTGCGPANDSVEGAGDGDGDGTATTIDFWGWVPGMDKLVERWNSENPDIKVNYSGQAAGNDETLAKITAAVKAGNGPCLSQVDGKWTTSMVSSGLFEDVTKEAAQYKGNFPAGLWSGVDINGTTYGIPQDSGPMVMYYNAAKFKEFGVEVPKTWDEFKAVALKIQAEHPESYLTGFSSDDAETLQSFVQQAGGQWWSIDGEQWKVDVTGAASEKVGAFWQELIEKKAVSPTKRWDPAFYNEVANGTVLSVVGAAWQAPLLAENAAAASGDWSVAHMPQWKAGETASANNGGSNTMVLAGCKNPAETLKFANWLNTNTDGLLDLGLFPAASSTTLKTPESLSTFFGGEDVYSYLSDAAGNIKTPWTFAPSYSKFSSTIGDGIAASVTGKTTIPALLKDLQKSSLDSLTEAGIAAVAAK